MGLWKGVGRVFDPDPTWNETGCICGFDLRVPSRLGGRKGRCPQCGRALVTTGQMALCPTAGVAFESNHPEREAKRLYHEPNFSNAESGYAVAQRYTAVPGVLYLLATLGIAQIVLKQSPTVAAALGVTEPAGWLLPAWLLACWMAVATATATSALMFHWITARSYAEDRVMFASAGGYDIARWAPLFCYLVLFIVYARVLSLPSDDVLASVRTPWRFVLIGAAAGHLATLLVAWRVFHCRFERSVQPVTEQRSEAHVAIDR